MEINWADLRKNHVNVLSNLLRSIHTETEIQGANLLANNHKNEARQELHGCTHMNFKLKLNYCRACDALLYDSMLLSVSRRLRSSLATFWAMRKRMTDKSFNARTQITNKGSNAGESLTDKGSRYVGRLER